MSTISIFGISYKVIGVYFDPGGEREESQVFLPLTSARAAFNGGDNIRNMSFTVKMSENFDEAVALSKNVTEAIEADLKEKLIIAPDDTAAIRVNNTLEEAQKIGYPIMLKAASGGGGRGMRIVREDGGLSQAFNTAQTEAETAFGNPALYMEKFFESPFFFEFSPFQYENPVRLLDGGKPVGDGNGGTVLCDPPQRSQDVLLGAAVQRTGRLVEQQQFGLSDDCPCQADAPRQTP